MNIKNKLGKFIYDYLERQGLIVKTKEEYAVIDAQLLEYKNQINEQDVYIRQDQIIIAELEGFMQHKKDCRTIKYIDNGSIHHKCDCGFQRYLNYHKVRK